jgi:SAM-dependent methyltransferase
MAECGLHATLSRTPNEPQFIGRATRSLWRGLMRCPCCDRRRVRTFSQRSGFQYFACSDCAAIFIDPEVLAKIEDGRSLVRYDDAYWAAELPAARERASGPCLARAAEALYYCRIPVTRFLDIGTGPGYFLDAVERYLPTSAGLFYGVEKFPPPVDQRSSSKRYIVGDLGELDPRFDAGICVEVLEHLTPKMVRKLFTDLAHVATPGAMFLFNTGLPDYVIHEDPAYLDPLVRGHIVSYSVKSLRRLLAGLPFTIRPIRGKTWAFCAELDPSGDWAEDVSQRIWSPRPENVAILDDPIMGSVLKILGRETVAAYL